MLEESWPYQSHKLTWKQYMFGSLRLLLTERIGECFWNNASMQEDIGGEETIMKI